MPDFGLNDLLHHLGSFFHAVDERQFSILKASISYSSWLPVVLANLALVHCSSIGGFQFILTKNQLCSVGIESKCRLFLFLYFVAPFVHMYLIRFLI